jgi:hypothetical protein
MSANDFLAPVSDDELHSFIDGEIDPERRNAVVSFLKASASDTDRVENWRRQVESIRAAFVQVELEPVPLSVLLPPLIGRSKFPCKLLLGKDRQTEPRQAEVGKRFEFPRKHRQTSFLVVAFASGIIITIVATPLIDRINAMDQAPQVSDNPTPSAETDDFSLPRSKPIQESLALSSATAQSTFPVDKLAAAPNPIALFLPAFSGIESKFVSARIAPNAFDKTSCLFYAKAADRSLSVRAMMAAPLASRTSVVLKNVSPER